jgi:hypothetical protein
MTEQQDSERLRRVASAMSDKPRTEVSEQDRLRFERVIRAAQETAGTTREGLSTDILATREPDRSPLPLFIFNNPFDRKASAQRINERMDAGYNSPYLPLIESPLLDATMANLQVGSTTAEINEERIRSGQTPFDILFDDHSYAPSAQELVDTANEFGLSDAWFDRLADAKSPEDLQAIARAGQERTRRAQSIHDTRGLPAEAIKFAGAMMDPTFLAAGFGTGTLLKVAHSGTRLGTALRSGSAAVLADAPLEGFRALDDPEVTPLQAGVAVMASGIFSSAIGGALGRSMPADDLTRLEEDLTALAQTDYGSSVGAKQLGPIFRELDDGSVEVVDAPDQQRMRWSSPSTWFASVIPAQRLQQSKSPTVRKLAERLSWNPQIAGNQSTTAFEVSRRITEGAGAFARRYKEAEKAFYAGDRAFTGGTSTAQRDAFSRAVWRHMNGVERSTDENVLAAAESLSDMQLDALAYAQSRAYGGGDLDQARTITARGDTPDYDGFDAVRSLVHDPDYLPRRFSVDGIQNLRSKATDDDIIDMLAGSMTRANPERFGDDFAKARTVAGHYWNTVLDVFVRQDEGPRFAKKTFQDRQAALQEVRDVLKAQGKNPDDIAEEAMELLLEELAPLQRAVSETDRAKPRMKLDLSAEFSRGLDEIFEQDAISLAMGYRREMGGLAAFHRAGFNSVAEFDKALSKAAKELDRDKSVRSSAEVLDELRYWRDTVLGKPSDELAKNPRTSWFAQQLRRTNFAAYMSNVAFAATAELFGHTMRVGPFNLMARHAEMNAYLKRARKGDLTMADDVYDLADSVMGHGTGMLRAELAQRTERYDFELPDVSNPFRDSARNAAERVDTYTRKAANAVSRFSGMAPLQQFMRMTHVTAEAQYLVKKAKAGELPYSRRRMETMGISGGMWERIADQLRRSGTITSPDTGRQLPMIRQGDWVDREAAEAFIGALDRNARRMILEGDLGHAPRFIREKPLVSLLFQFLSFPINAWTKHSGYLGNVRDGRAFAEAMVMSLGGMVGVQARTFLQGSSIEDPERRAKFFEERLNLNELAKSAVYYSAHASLLPNIYDTALRYGVGSFTDVPEEAYFSHTRNSGLASNFLTGNPTVATLDKLVNAPRKFREGQAFSKQDVQNLMKLAPFGNSVATLAVSEWLLAGLPEEDVN